MPRPERRAPENPVNSRSRVLIASLVGTSIEFYDFAIYATAAVLVFPSLFFANDDPTVSLLQSFAAFGVAFIARPIGAIFFGHFGDRVGRKQTLVASLLVMGIATVLIGLLPDAFTPGWSMWAPTLLVLLRFCQGFGIGGEWSGAALLATENAPSGKRAIYGAFPQLGAPIGFLLATGTFLLLSLTLTDAQFLSWGWRVPFLASVLLVIVGWYVRSRIAETPAFEKVVARGDIVRMPLARVLRTSWRRLILGAFIMLASFTLSYLMSTFTLTFGTTPQDAAVPGLGYPRDEFLTILLGGIVLFGIFTMVSGPLAERFGRRAHLIVVTSGIVVFGLLFVPLLSSGLPGVAVLLVVGFSLSGLTYGPMATVLPELFASNVRYTGSAISYNVASILGAALAPTISVALWGAAGGSPVLVGLYLSAMGVVTLVALVVSAETKDSEFIESSS